MSVITISPLGSSASWPGKPKALGIICCKLYPLAIYCKPNASAMISDSSAGFDCSVSSGSSIVSKDGGGDDSFGGREGGISGVGVGTGVGIGAEGVVLGVQAPNNRNDVNTIPINIRNP